MATVHVRRLDPDVVERLERSAAANHRSLESEIRQILSNAAEDQMAAKRRSFPKLAVRLRRRTQVRTQTPSEVLIRNDRDSGHRLV